MPQKSWAVGEEVLAADFNTYAQNQVVPQFTTTAQRDSQWSSPPNGAMCVTVDTGTYWQRVAGAWQKCFGRLAQNSRTTSAGPAGTTDATLGVDITLSTPGNRLIRLEGFVRGVIIASGAGLISIKEGATTITQGQSPSAGASGVGSAVFVARTVQPTAGSHTYGLYVAASTGQVTVQGDPTYPITLEAFDAGAP